MKVSIHVVTVGKHFSYFKYMLRSVEKFASGYTELCILCPTNDRFEMERMAQMYHGSIPLWITYFDEWPGKGMLHHEFLVMNADVHCRGDFIQHMDSDHVFTEPVTPENYFVDGKPILVYHDFPTLIRENKNLRFWQESGERAMGISDDYEFMRRAPLVHCREVYPASRLEIEAHTRQPLDQFVRAQRNEFPQGFAEYQALGSTAWRRFRERYAWVRQGWTAENKPKDNKLTQFWSHRPPTIEDRALCARLGLE